ncbi:NAD-dependent epimerase/dehydratase family protein [Leptolyngbya cf. ectocarpi LEGE 11479]|uniref:NAD-dependent epimerase/dehydratase family protein n=1 Tax=Leptolyngbya cf. ectocarpi LEGE 11479 TaxID=1828722 RepID=A0A928ZYR4_LEPEC|nr:NAD-dependent epimerase/dehydratase family protein [Leptolyngbya ectocarpi]MBE9069915.1 NAD-dependent epimerase/dehydratase family protein [Leptolyngbya cf. ectocarpi LEGE 11479]
MKVLVTGATGFLGGHLVAKLMQAGDQVRILARPTAKVESLQQQDVEIVYGDLSDQTSLKTAVDGVDVVYHLGAAMGGSWANYEDITVRGTQRMLEVSLAAGVQRFVHISSLAVYQVYGLKRNAIIDETRPCDPTPEKVGSYCRSKVEAEKIVLQYYGKGLPVTIIRPGLIYGPRGRVMFPHIGQFLKNKIFLLIGQGTNLLPFTYVENTVEAIRLAGVSETAVGQIYQVVDDSEITQREYLNKFMAATRSQFPTLPIPFFLFIVAAFLVDRLKTVGLLKSSTFSQYGVISKYKSLRFDSSKAKKELNWAPHIGIEEGLSKTFAWYNKAQANA